MELSQPLRKVNPYRCPSLHPTDQGNPVVNKYCLLFKYLPLNWRVWVLTHPLLPLSQELSVEVVDSHYSQAGYLIMETLFP